jgi:hypothetical protein
MTSIDLSCSPLQSADRDVVAAMVAAARDSQALVVVLDIATIWSDPQGPDKLTDALTKNANETSRSPVVMPLMYRARPSPDAADRSFLVITPLPEASGPKTASPAAGVYFGLPFAYPEPGPMSEGVVRLYARSVATDALRSHGERIYPTLAGAAACLADTVAKELVIEPVSKLAANREACDQPAVIESPTRIWFSVPPMRASDHDIRLQRLEQRNLVFHEKASESFESFASPTRHFRDTKLLYHSIVVIGSSRDGRDYHATPLGVMAGAEIVLNAIRSFLEYSPGGEVSWGWSVLIEVPVIAVTATVFAGFWYWFARRATRHAKADGEKLAGHWRSWIRVVRTTVSGAVFGLFCCFSLMAAFLCAIMLQTASHYDVLTPILLTALEGAAEGAHCLITRTEDLIDRIPLPRLRIFGLRDTSSNEEDRIWPGSE